MNAALEKETEVSQDEVLETTLTELDLARKELEETKALIEAKKHELKLKGARAYDKQDLDSIEKKITSGNKNNALAKKIAAQRDYDNVMVTGKFLNQRAPGQQVKLPYCKHVGDQDKWYTFDHGKVYTIKRGFADQINEYYAKITHNQKLDVTISDEQNPGTPLESTVRHQLYSFSPVSW